VIAADGVDPGLPRHQEPDPDADLILSGAFFPASAPPGNQVADAAEPIPTAWRHPARLYLSRRRIHPPLVPSLAVTVIFCALTFAGATAVACSR
jgi:hypothetical protein